MMGTGHRVQSWVLDGLKGHIDIKGICDCVFACESTESRYVCFHFSPDRPERRSRTGLLYVSAVGVHGAAAKDSALPIVVCVASHVTVVCVCVCVPQAQPHYLPNLQAGTAAAACMRVGWRDPLGSQVAPGWASATAKKKPWSWNPEASATRNFLNIFTFTTSELDMLVLI